MALIEIRNLKIHYPIRSGFWNRVTDHVLAVDASTSTSKKAKPTADWRIRFR